MAWSQTQATGADGAVESTYTSSVAILFDDKTLDNNTGSSTFLDLSSAVYYQDTSSSGYTFNSPALLTQDYSNVNHTASSGGSGSTRPSSGLLYPRGM